MGLGRVADRIGRRYSTEGTTRPGPKRLDSLSFTPKVFHPDPAWPIGMGATFDYLFDLETHGLFPVDGWEEGGVLCQENP